MDGDPYARMAELMRGVGGQSGAGGVRLYQGTVAQTEPLEVSTAGLRLPAGALRLCSGLSLEAEDPVLLLTEDDQIFYIIAKVVDAE